jgi:hypothetical protein
VAENFERRREPGGNSGFLGRPTVAAWVIVVVLVLIAFIGLGTLRGRAHTSANQAGIVNPTHDARCPDFSAAGSDRCGVQRSSEPVDRSDSSAVR